MQDSKNQVRHTPHAHANDRVQTMAVSTIYRYIMVQGHVAQHFIKVVVEAAGVQVLTAANRPMQVTEAPAKYKARDDWLMKDRAMPQSAAGQQATSA